MPNAIHPHCVVPLDCSLFVDAAAAPAAATAAGLRPDVVVALVVTVLVTAGEAEVCVTVGAVWVTTTVLVSAGACSVAVWVDAGRVGVVAGVDRVGVESVGVVRVATVLVGVLRVAKVLVAFAAVLPPPHDVRATAVRTPRIPAQSSLELKASAATA
jgi:hypothetical protein